MDPHLGASPSTEVLLINLARTFLWYASQDEQGAIEAQVRQLLGCQQDHEFDAEVWARELLQNAKEQDAEFLAADADPFVVRAGSKVGICMGQKVNERGEFLSAIQLHPNERVVLVEAGIEPLKRDEVIAVMRNEITGMLTRARFLGLDQLTVELLCQEALTISRELDVERLWAQAEATPTLGDGEAINQMVRITGVQLHEPFRVTLWFDDGVSRTVDLGPFLSAPDFAPVRRPNFFIQLRIKDGTLRWPNGATLDPAILRYVPALSLAP